MVRLVKDEEFSVKTVNDLGHFPFIFFLYIKIIKEAKWIPRMSIQNLRLDEKHYSWLWDVLIAGNLVSYDILFCFESDQIKGKNLVLGTSETTMLLIVQYFIACSVLSNM